jgi:hypothetical protein
MKTSIHIQNKKMYDQNVQNLKHISKIKENAY